MGGNFIINRLIDRNGSVPTDQLYLFDTCIFPEGSECQAFSGGQHFLDTIFVPYIFMEWSLGLRLKEPGTPCNHADVARMVNDLIKRGFTPYNYGGGKLQVQAWPSWKKSILDIVWVHKNAKPLWPKRV